MKKYALLYLPAIFALASAPAYATTLSILAAGDTGMLNGATFTGVTTQPTGSGVIGSFLRIQAKGTEQGYNTGGGTPFDDKGGISLNNGDLSVSDFASTCVLLDVNQSQDGTKALISLDSLQVYTSPTHNLTTTNLAGLGTLRYDMGSGNSVIINSAIGHGSGSGDVEIDFPSSIFSGAASTDAVYLYAHFGNTYGSNGGFEEYALLMNCPPPGGGGGNPPPVPEPASLALLPLGLLGLALRHARAAR